MWRDERGQTLYDFALGTAIFLLVLGYVFAFVPTLFEPFAPIEDSTASRADRTANALVHGTLSPNESRTGGNPTEAAVLSVPCTAAFFGGGSPPARCGFSRPVTNEDTIREITGLPDRTHVNVTMRRNGTVATHEATGTGLAAGPPPTRDARRVVRVVRIVQFDGRDYEFVVKLW